MKTLKNYEYISTSKVNMLYDQLSTTTSIEETSELDASVSMSLVSLSGKQSSKKNRSVTVYNKIERIKREAELQNKVGTITHRNDYIVDNCTMVFSYGNGLATWRGSFFDRSQKTLYRFLMYGSEFNLIMNQDSRLRSANHISASSHREFFHGLIEACKCSLNKDTEIQDLVNNASLGDEYSWIHELNLEKWQLVEWFFYDRGMWTTFSPSLPFEFFARVDFCQTITRDYYEKSREKDESAWMNFHPEIFTMPSQVEQIVYVYASPIYVARKEYPKYKKLFINDRSYLYIPDKELKKICLYTSNNRRLFKTIIKLLNDNGLTKEAIMMEEETDCKLGVLRNPNKEEDALSDADIMKIIHRYVTTTEPH